MKIQMILTKYPLFLDAPTCKASQKSLYGVGMGEDVNISCEVDSDPKDVTFRWALNNSVENVDLQNFTSAGTRSVLTFTPKTVLEFGAVLCWGQNTVGKQKEPCVARIIPAGNFRRFFNTIKKKLDRQFNHKTLLERQKACENYHMF